MESRTVIPVVLIVAAVLIVMAAAFQQINTPLLREIRDQQNLILQNQGEIERRLNGLQAGGAAGADARIAALEKSMTELVNVIKRAAQADSAPPRPPAEYFDEVHQIPEVDTPVKGPADAPVTIAEFVDFQCPYCARFHPVLNEVFAAFPGKVKIVLKNFPLSFHPQARPAAYAALAAGEQGKYWEMADLLLASHGNLSEEKIGGLAGQIGLDMDKFWKDFRDRRDEWNRIIKRDMDLGNTVDVRGTPTFYLNGKKTRARSVDAFKEEIDGILSK